MNDKLELLREKQNIMRQIESLDTCPLECNYCEKVFDNRLNVLLDRQTEIMGKLKRYDK